MLGWGYIANLAGRVIGFDIAGVFSYDSAGWEIRCFVSPASFELQQGSVGPVSEYITENQKTPMWAMWALTIRAGVCMV